MIQRVSRFCKRSLIIFSLICGTGNLVITYADGLPGEYLATQRWRFLFSSQSPVSNPALINEANYISLRYALSSSMGEFNMQEIGLVYPMGLYQSFALTALLQGANPYEQTTDKFDTIGTVNDQQYFFMGSYAYNLWAGLTVGANVNLSMYPFNDNDMGVGADIGLTYRVLNNPVIGTHLLGISLQNAIMVLTKSKEKYPRNLRFSLNSTYAERLVESGLEFSLKDVASDKSEYLPDSIPQMEWDMNAKIGFWVLRLANLYGIASLSQDGLKCWGFAAGFNIPSVNNGRDLSIIYQFLSKPEDNLNESHTFYVKADVGKHREEIYARKMAKMANVSPNNLYLRAVELYSQGNYWDAFFIFSQLYVEFPDFFKNDWVSYFLSSCQENLDMRSTSEEAYLKTKSQFSKSAVIPFADLGLMRVYYRDANMEGVDRQFNELNKLGVPDSIKFHGYYIMGQSEIQRGNKTKAKQLFDLIPEYHPDYVFAQHSAAIIAASSDNIENAVSCLENCVQAQVTTEAQKEIVNRSYVFLGYIFYEELTKEEGTLAKAVTALRMVPKNSFYYTDALLGLGWTGLKARQWNDCMNAGQELASIAKSPVLKAEGTLLQAYSNMMQKNYSAAANLLGTASSDLQSYQADAEQELALKKQENNEVRLKYSDLARAAYDLGTARQSSLVEKQIDSLHTVQKQLKGDIDKYIAFTDDYQRNSFFNRSYESVKEDVDYALAKAEKHAGTSKSVKETEKINKDTEKIDDELEKLKKELEKEENKAQ